MHDFPAMQIIFDRPTIDRAVERANAIQVRRGLYTWAKYFCQLVFLEIGSKLNLYVQYSKIEIYLEIRGFDNLKENRGRLLRWSAFGVAVRLVRARSYLDFH